MITSTSNPKVKYLVQLQKKRKLREEKGIFLVEGVRMFRETPKELIEEIYISEQLRSKNPDILQGLSSRVEILTETVFRKISETQTPQGILCIVKRKNYCLAELLKNEKAHILVLDGLQDPGNVGTILRTAEAAGVTGIIVSNETADLYQPKTIRSTMGSIFRMPCVVVEDVVDTINEMKKNNIFTFAAHLEGEKWYNEVMYTGKTAFLIGNEGNGLSKEVAEQADTWIRIPMEGEVESLNAAVAATVLMYEAYRQRRK
ncbi:MAG: 23S rRNA (guanosine(2251)-2'-O)-methyltransferase RlmB [Eubacteriales bacterium]